MEASGLVLVRSRGALPERLPKERRGVVIRLLRAVGLLGLAAYAAHSLLGLGGHGLDDLFENWVFNGLLLVGAALCLLRAAWSRLERGAWTVLGVGLTCWALGEILHTVDPAQVTNAPFPSTSDSCGSPAPPSRARP
ncbi:MAG: hypothetical protein ACLQMH_12390 [Solirubrobacteraceae bacterium]